MVVVTTMGNFPEDNVLIKSSHFTQKFVLLFFANFINKHLMAYLQYILHNPVQYQPRGHIPEDNNKY